MQLRDSGLLLTLTVVLFSTICGCAAQQNVGAAWPAPRPLGSDLNAISAPVQPDQAVSYRDISVEVGGSITLRQALTLALMRNPELAGASWEIRAREAKKLQAGLIPNPGVSVAIEEFGGSADRAGFDVAETTVEVSQLIELGGKRAKRERVAALEKDLAGWDYEAKRLDLLTDVAKAFIGVLGAQEKVALTEELVRIAGQVHQSVSERVEAGKVSPLEAIKAAVTLSNTRIQLEQAKTELAAAKKQLAATWGEVSPSFERVEGELFSISSIPSAEALQNRLSQNPDIARWAQEMEQRTAALELEKARRIPDLTVSGGVAHFNESDENALVVGASIPIPLFDRNQGGVFEAQHRLSKGREEQRAAGNKTSASFAESYRALAFAFVQSTSLKDEVLPASRQAFEAASEGYREGKFDFLEFLDAQRTFFEAKASYVEALTAYHKAKADVERLIGEGLDTVKEAPKK